MEIDEYTLHLSLKRAKREAVMEVAKQAMGFDIFKPIAVGAIVYSKEYVEVKDAKVLYVEPFKDVMLGCSPIVTIRWTEHTDAGEAITHTDDADWDDLEVSVLAEDVPSPVLNSTTTNNHYNQPTTR